MREITIAGGGLAGLSLASALRLHEIPVKVLEAGTYPRHRVCGEFISGVSPHTLDALGITPSFKHALLHRTLCWHVRGREIHRDTLDVPAFGISRYFLDENLRNHVSRLGGVIETGIRAQPEPAEGRVWAAGRRPRNGPWIGLKAHVRGIPMTADLEMHSGDNGYTGLAGVEDGWTNVCGLFRINRALRANSTHLLPAYVEAGGNPRLARLLREAEWRDGSFSAIAGFELGRQPEIPGMPCLGDAESMIPPFTGNGMSMAFQSAECAIAPLVSWSHGETSWQVATLTLQSALRRKFRRRLAVAGCLHPLLTRLHSGGLPAHLSDLGILPFRPALALLR
jgi:2-polyprenyl-6-methoxyphenol hydroxylase-like FAD-dependent oxidoreductase